MRTLGYGWRSRWIILSFHNFKSLFRLIKNQYLSIICFVQVMLCLITRRLRILNSITAWCLIIKMWRIFWRTLHQIRRGNAFHIFIFYDQFTLIWILGSILHLFPWSGIVNEDSQLSETFRVPDPKTGQMRRLISQIPPKEEEMFRNMVRRINTIVKVTINIFSMLV